VLVYRKINDNCYLDIYIKGLENFDEEENENLYKYSIPTTNNNF